MKNLLKLAFLFFCFAIAWQCYSVKKYTRMNSLILQNIEALADDNESVETVICIGRGSVDCAYSVNKVEYIVSDYGL